MKKIKKIFISAFIFLIFLTMVRTHMPSDSALTRLIFSRIDPFLSFFSFYQDWMMFAPNPMRFNYKFHAEIEFDDGAVTKVELDSSSTQGHWDKYLHGEKMRKFLQDTIANRSNHFAYKDLSKYILRQLKVNHFNKIPLRLKLVLSKNMIPAPDVEFKKIKKQKLKFTNEVLYIHEVF